MKIRLRTRIDGNHNLVLGASRDLGGGYGHAELQDMRSASDKDTMWVVHETPLFDPRTYHLRTLASSDIYLAWSGDRPLYRVSVGNDPNLLTASKSMFRFDDADTPGQDPAGGLYQKLSWPGGDRVLDVAGAQSSVGAPVIAFRPVGSAQNQDWWVEYCGPAD